MTGADRGQLAGRHRAGVDRRAPRPGQRGRRLPGRGRRQERAGPAGAGGQGQDRGVHRQLLHQPGDRRATAYLHCRLRADGVRHRCHHGGAGAGRAGLAVRRGVRAADRAHRPAAGRLRRRSLPGRRSGDQLGQRRTGPDRPAGGRGEGRHHRLPGAHRPGPRRDQLPVAGLAVQPAALLGRAVPDRLRRQRPADRAAGARCCRCCCRRPTTSPRSPTRRTTWTPFRSRRWAG